jgi:hypothetical protein
MPNKLTLEKIKKTIKYIESVADDSEKAHSVEDLLYYDFVRAVANEDCEDIVICAKEILKTYDIKFLRWCA